MSMNLYYSVFNLIATKVISYNLEKNFFETKDSELY